MSTRRPHVGLAIKERRIARAMTRAELSRATGLSEPHLYRVETGARSPSDVALVKIAQALDCAVTDLTAAPDPKGTAPGLMTFAEAVAICGPELVAKLAAYAATAPPFTEEQKRILAAAFAVRSDEEGDPFQRDEVA